MIGNIFSYLHKDAYKYGDPERARISYETATGYASSVKVYFTNKFRNCGPELNVFSSAKWRELRNKLLAQSKEEAKSTGKALVNGHQALEDADRDAIAVGCYLVGTVEAAEFLHLNNTMMRCSGRGTEVSLVTKDCVKVSDVNELCYVRIRAKRCKNQIVTADRLLAVLDMRPSTTTTGSHTSYGSFNIYTIIGTILDPELNKRINKIIASDDLDTRTVMSTGVGACC